MGAVIRSLPRAVALCLAICLCAVSGLVFAVSARADEVRLTAELTDVQVLGTSPQSEIILTGRVINNGTVPAHVVQAIMWRSNEPVTDLPTFHKVVAGEETPYGSRVVRREVNYATLTAPGQAFAPGATATFSVRTTLAESGFTRLDAAYQLGVDIRGSSDGSSNFQTLARSRTLVPLPGPTSRATTIPAVLLTSKPSHLYGTYFADDHLGTELAPSGRLTQLLDLIIAEGLDYIIDPSLYAEVAAMQGGYTIRTAAGTTTAGTGAAAAEAWLSRFSELPANRGYRTMFAIPDIEQAGRIGDSAVLTRAQQALTGLPETITNLPLLAVPAGVQGTDAAARFAQTAAPKALLTRLLLTEQTLVAGDVPLVRVWSTPTDQLGVHRALAHRLTASTEAMLLGHTAQPLVRLLSTTSDIADEAALPSWVTRSRLAPLLAAPASRVTPTFADLPPGAGLPHDTFSNLDDTEAKLRTFAQLAPTSPQAAAINAITARATSANWVGRATDRGVWLRAATVEVDTTLRQNTIQLHASTKFVMSSNVNEFPITITNRLPYPVKVKVKLESSSPQRLAIGDTDVVTVNPNESRTVNIQPEAATNGVATVTAQLATEAGTTIGTPIEITVESTQFGLVGWAIVIVSGIVLVATTAWSIKKSEGRTRAKEKA